jgi:hypothetical protein
VLPLSATSTSTSLDESPIFRALPIEGSSSTTRIRRTFVIHASGSRTASGSMVWVPGFVGLRSLKGMKCAKGKKVKGFFQNLI